MNYYNKNWLYKDYKKLYIDTTKSEPTEEEELFLKSYFNTLSEDGAKKIYYMAVFRLKRGWYRFIVYFLIKKSLKNDLKNLDGIAKLNKVFATKMLHDAIRAYCKLGD